MEPWSRNGTLTRVIEMQIIKKFIPVKATFRGDDSHNPLFICSQRIAGTPKLNQLANKAL
jgi:hypothetical protein